MTSEEILGVVAVVGLILTAAILAMTETTLTHLGRARASAIDAQSVADGRKTKVGDLVERRSQVLNPVLLLVLLCHLGVATTLGVMAYRRWDVTGAIVAIVVEAAVIFVVAEAAPKTYALQSTDRAVTVVAPLARALSVVAPLRWVTSALIGASNVLLPGKGRREGPSVTEDELLALAGTAAAEHVIEPAERKLIESIIKFGDEVVREVMVPRPDMVTVQANDSVQRAVEVAVEKGLSRLPVEGDSIDDIVGIAYVKDLLDADRSAPVLHYLRAARFVPESKAVPELLKEMQAEQYHIAVVVDEYGGTAGLVTLEDLIEELVGEIYDEYEVPERRVEAVGGGALLVDAGLPIAEVNEQLRSDLPSGDWDTIGGLFFDLLGRVPEKGEAVEVNGHRLEAEDVEGRRIVRVRIGRPAVPEPAEG